MDEACTLDTTVFNRMIGDLVTLGGPGTDAAAVVRGETGKLLERCVRYTPTAREEIIDQRTMYRERRDYSSYSGGLTGKYAQAEPRYIVQGQQNDKAWFVTTDQTLLPANPKKKTRRTRNYAAAGRDGKVWHLMNGNRRWPDALWQEYQREEADRKADYEAHLAKELAAGRASRGLTARSWLDIADALGLDLRIDEYVRRAVPSNGKHYVNGRGRIEQNGDATLYILENFQPILLREGGEEIVERAMAAGAKAFDVAVEKGLFNDTEFLRKRYPALLA